MSRPFLHEAKAPGRAHFEILAMAWAGWVFDFYDLILYSFLLIPLGREFHFSREQLSWIFGASLAATAAGGVLFGFLSDRFGRKAILQATILVFSAGTFASGLAPSFFWLMVARIVTGLGVGGEWGTGQTYVAETFPARVRARYGAFVQTGAPIGVALASVVGGFLAPAIGWRACFLVSGIPALLVVAVRKYLPESDVWEAHRRDPRGGSAPSRIAVILSPAHRGVFLRGLLLTIFTMSAYWFTYTWLPGYLHDERHFSMAKSASWILVTQAGGLLGYASFGFVADRWGRRPAFTAYSLVFAAGLAMTTVFWGSIASTPGVVLAFMFLVGLGTGVWGGFGPLFAELFPTPIRGAAMGSIYNIARGVQFVTPIVVTVIARRWGLAGGMSLAAVFAAATAAWIWTFPETKGEQIA
ncbi:MAG TPA: MFS transporter [Thermoanaerobaculia bacterium]|nr:MFS transporter [Thermoanaerobaculia bacterium]